MLALLILVNTLSSDLSRFVAIERATFTSADCAPSVRNRASATSSGNIPRYRKAASVSPMARPIVPVSCPSRRPSSIACRRALTGCATALAPRAIATGPAYRMPGMRSTASAVSPSKRPVPRIKAGATICATPPSAPMRSLFPKRRRASSRPCSPTVSSVSVGPPSKKSPSVTVSLFETTASTTPAAAICRIAVFRRPALESPPTIRAAVTPGTTNWVITSAPLPTKPTGSIPAFSRKFSKALVTADE